MECYFFGLRDLLRGFLCSAKSAYISAFSHWRRATASDVLKKCGRDPVRLSKGKVEVLTRL